MKFFLILLMACFLVGCGPSQREIDLENQLKKTEERLEKSEEKLEKVESQLEQSENKIDQAKEEHSAQLAKITSEKNALKGQLDALTKERDLQAQKELDELKKKQSKIKINGTVFIKTKGGQNFKLALIPIGVSTDQEYKEASSKVMIEVNRVLEKNLSLLSQNKAEYDKLKKLYEQEKKIWNSYEMKILQLEKYENVPLDMQLDVTRQSSHSTPSIYKRIGSSYTFAEASQYANAVNSPIASQKKHSVKCNSLAHQISNNVKIYVQLVKEIDQSYASRVRETIDLLQQKSVLSRSDPDGNFNLELQREKNYILTGYGKRDVAGTSEVYNWIIPINVAKDDQNVEVFFSNTELTDNILGDEKILEDVDVAKFRVKAVSSVMLRRPYRVLGF